MKKLITAIAILLFSGAVYAQAPTQTPLTKDQLETALKNVQTEKRYLELQVQEANLKAALEKMKTDAPKPEAKKEKAK